MNIRNIKSNTLRRAAIIVSVVPICLSIAALGATIGIIDAFEGVGGGIAKCWERR